MANVNWTPWPPHSMEDLARPSDGKRPPRRLITYYHALKKPALRRLLEPKLAALVGVEDLGLPVPGQRLLKRLHAERGVHADRHPVRQDSTARPVDDRAQIDPAAGHRDVRDIGGPDLVGPVDLELAQQVRIDLVGRVLLARVGLAVQRLDSHALHQRANMAAPDVEPLAVEQ